MKICFSVSNLELGGAQMFVVRLANELAERGHGIIVYDHWPEYRNAGMAAMLSHRVRIASYSESAAARWFTWKINAVLKRLRIHPAFRHRRNRKRFERLLRKERPQVLNSHASFSDFVIAESALPPDCTYIPTLHGEYELMMEGSGRERVREQVQAAIARARAVIYTAPKNLQAISGLAHPPTRQINVGFDKNAMPVKKITRQQLGIPAHAAVLGMVARGIPEKRWDIAIRAYQRLVKENRPAALILIGDGEYLKKLVSETGDPGIHLLQFGNDMLTYYSYYQLFDIFLFPSTFSGESVPNAVIEALSWNVPVLASRHAGISGMLLENTAQSCGVTVPVDGQFAANFTAALLRLMAAEQSLREMAKACPRAFANFEMKTVCDQYLATFAEAAGSHAEN